MDALSGVETRHDAHPFTRAAQTGLRFIPVILLGLALLSWSTALGKVDLSQMNDLGLVSVLPVSFYFAMILLAASFTLVLFHRPLNEWLAGLHLIVLILVIHATPQLLYGTLRYSWAWKHVGIVDYIIRHGSVDPNIQTLSAYHNWPGFFALSALFTQAAGLESPLSFAGWAPVFFSLLDLGALLLIFRLLSPDRRLAWTGAWFFFLANWIGQEYFSPQAFAFFLYLVILGILLAWFQARPVAWGGLALHIPLLGRAMHVLKGRTLRSLEKPGVPRPVASPRQRVAWMLLLIAMTLVIVASHQLTPLMLISALAFLVIFGITPLPGFLLLAGVFMLAWAVFMASGFFNHNLYWIVKSIGDFLANFNGNLINLSTASPAQVLIARIDRALSAFVWSLGILGLIRRLRLGRVDWAVILLALSPLPLVVTNSYGGEILFRVYLFTLPFAAFLVGGLLFPALHRANRPWTPIVHFLLSGVLMTGFLFAYYGKELMFSFTPQEVSAAQTLNRIARPGSLIVSATADWPLHYQNYELYNYLSLVDLPKDDIQLVLKDPAGTLSDWMDDAPAGSVLFNNAQAYAALMRVWKPDPSFLALGIPPQYGVGGPAGSTQDLDDYPDAYLILTRSQIAQLEMTGQVPASTMMQVFTKLMSSSQFKVVYLTRDAVIFQYIPPMENPDQ